MDVPWKAMRDRGEAEQAEMKSGSVSFAEMSVILPTVDSQLARLAQNLGRAADSTAAAARVTDRSYGPNFSPMSPDVMGH